MTSSTLLHQARQALQSGDRERARRLLTDVLRTEPRSAPAWLLMCEVVEQRAHKLDCLMRVLAIEPDNAEALARLNLLSPPPESQAVSLPPMSTAQAAPGESKPFVQPKPPIERPPTARATPPIQSSLAPGLAAQEASPLPSVVERLRIERRRRQGYRYLMLAGAMIISMFCGIVLLTLTVTQVVPRGQAIRRERLSVTPTPGPVLYQATLWCPPCEQAGDAVILWEKVGDGISRGGKVGELPHDTTVNVHEEVWSEPEGRTYYRISAGDQKGWVPETFIKP